MKVRLLGLMIAAILLLIMGSGCAWYRNNKCWIGVDHYNVARTAYEELGNLQQTREELELLFWRPCEINQALYWIEKDFYLDSAEDLQ